MVDRSYLGSEICTSQAQIWHVNSQQQHEDDASRSKGKLSYFRDSMSHPPNSPRDGRSHAQGLALTSAMFPRLILSDTNELGGSMDDVSTDYV